MTSDPIIQFTTLYTTSLGDALRAPGYPKYLSLILRSLLLGSRNSFYSCDIIILGPLLDPCG
jgi:hypothetical protein